MILNIFELSCESVWMEGVTTCGVSIIILWCWFRLRGRRKRYCQYVLRHIFISSTLLQERFTDVIIQIDMLESQKTNYHRILCLNNSFIFISEAYKWLNSHFFKIYVIKYVLEICSKHIKICHCYFCDFPKIWTTELMSLRDTRTVYCWILKFSY